MLFRSVFQPPRLHSWVPGLWLISQPGSLTLKSTQAWPQPFSTPTPPHPRLGVPSHRKSPPARHSGTLLSSLGSFFFFQKRTPPPSPPSSLRVGPLESAEALGRLPYWWKHLSDLLKLIPNRAPGPRAVPSKRRRGPWLSEPRKPGWRGAGAEATGKG